MNTTNKQYSTQAIDPSILDVLNISTDGKVVSAENWKTLWELVFKHINTLDAYCVTLEELRSEWSNSKALLDKQMLEFTSKYAALEQSFVHYGKEAPVNEHIKFWVQPVSNLKDKVLITFKELLATKDLLTNHINTLRDAMNIGFETLRATLDNDYVSHADAANSFYTKSEIESIVNNTVDYVNSKVVVDQTYNPESENAQSGKAVAEAISSIEVSGGDILIDQIFDPESENAQSGKAVAEALKNEIEIDGLIESLKEQNKGENLTFWVGTQAEYDAIEEKIQDCFYIITDDNSRNEIVAEVLNSQKDYIVEQDTSGIWTYRKWASGECELYGTNVITVGTTIREENVWRSEKIGVELPFAVYNHSAFFNTEGHRSWCSGSNFDLDVSTIYYVIYHIIFDEGWETKTHILVKGKWK